MKINSDDDSITLLSLNLNYFNSDIHILISSGKKWGDNILIFNYLELCNFKKAILLYKKLEPASRTRRNI